MEKVIEKVDPHWPKWKHHKDGRSKMVKSPAEEKFLNAEWKDSPADHGTVTYPPTEEHLAMLESMSGEDMVDGQEFEEVPEPKKRGRKPGG